MILLKIESIIKPADTALHEYQVQSVDSPFKLWTIKYKLILFNISPESFHRKLFRMVKLMTTK